MSNGSATCVDRTCKFCALTVLMFVIPNTKQMESNMFDFPLPLRPVIELKVSSQPLMTVRTAYDLKPSITTSTTFMLAGVDELRLLGLTRCVYVDAT